MRFLSAARFAALLPLLFVAGCAKVPASDTTSSSRLVEFTMTMRGGIDPTKYYFVLINRTDNPSDAGPAPVVNRPWGNGFAAAARSSEQGFVTAVVFNSNLGGTTGYNIYNVPSFQNANGETVLAKPYEIGNGVSGFVPIGAPDRYTTPQTGENKLTFRIDLARLPNPNAQYMQVNFLATDNLPVETGSSTTTDDSQSKIWDALGNGADTADVGSLTSPVTVEVTAGLYRSNATSSTPEPQDDVRFKLGNIVTDPSLDITDWSIQVLAQ